MKGGNAPIHIMRWAAADFVGDPVVKLALSRRDYRAIVLYVLVLNWSHIEGGDLPADLEALAAMIGMPKRDVEKGLPLWLEPPVDKPKLHIEDTVLFNGRVRRECVEELVYRAEQKERGVEGGRASARRRSANRSVDQVLDQPLERDGKGRSSPPSPAPTPAPVPAPAPGGSPPEGASVSDLTSAQRDATEALRLTAQATGRPSDELLVEASTTGRGASLVRLDTCTSIPWLRTTAQRLTAIRLRASAARDKTPPPPSDRASARMHGANVEIAAGLQPPPKGSILEGMSRERRRLERGDETAAGEPARPRLDAGDAGRPRQDPASEVEPPDR